MYVGCVYNFYHACLFHMLHPFDSFPIVLYFSPRIFVLYFSPRILMFWRIEKTTPMHSVTLSHGLFHRDRINFQFHVWLPVVEKTRHEIIILRKSPVVIKHHYYLFFCHIDSQMFYSFQSKTV